MTKDKIVMGAAEVEVRAPQDKILQDFKKMKSASKKEVQAMQKELGNIRMQMDDRLVKLKLADVRKLHRKLKQRLEEKIHLKFDEASIARTRTQLASVERALEKVAQRANGIKKSTSGIGDVFGSAKGIVGGLGFAVGLSQITQITTEAVKLAAKVEGVENAFNKLDDPHLLDDLNKATNNTITDFELMRSILTGLDLGATKNQLKTFAEFARLESVRKGTESLQVFNNILGGVLRGSTELLDNFGISLTELNKEIDTLADEKLGKASTSLSAVERRILSVDAATAIMNKRLVETGKIAETSGEVLAQKTKKIKDAQADLGKALINISNESASAIETYLSTVGGIYKVLIDLVVDVEIDENHIEDQVDKARSKTKKVIGKKWQILPDGSKIQVLSGGGELFDALNSSFDEIEKRRDELKTKRGTLTPNDVVDIRNIDTEITALEGFLKPKKELSQKLKVNFDLESDNLEFEQEYEGVKTKIEEFLKSHQNLSSSDFNVASGAFYDMILGNAAPGEAEQVLDNIIEKLNTISDIQKHAAEKRKADQEEERRREGEIHNLRMNSISEFGYALDGLGSHGETMVSYFNSALQAVLRIHDAVNDLDTDQFSGILGIASGGLGFVSKLFGLKKGGSVTNSGGSVSIQPYQKFASGVSGFTVPPGFNRDNYIVGVQSGERLDVTPANQVRTGNASTDKILRDVYNRIGALTEVVRNSKSSVQVINSSPDISSKIVETKASENRMKKSGYKLSDV